MDHTVNSGLEMDKDRICRIWYPNILYSKFCLVFTVTRSSTVLLVCFRVVIQSEDIFSTPKSTGVSYLRLVLF